jgi:hypothetical protein
MNKVNLLEFKELLKKATLNYSMDNVGLKFFSDTYKVGMRSSNAIVILNGDNNIISGITSNDTWELNFSDPSKNVKSYFDLIIPDESDEAIIEMKDEKIILKSQTQKSNIFFCSSHVITGFDGDGPRTSGDTVFEMDIDDNFMDSFNLIKKVAGSFGKVYFNVEDGEVSIESTDKTNSFSNGMKMSIGTSDYENINICFDFKTLNNIITLLNGDSSEFIFRIGYIPKTSGGMASFIRKDNSEKYYILSMREQV